MQVHNQLVFFNGDIMLPLIFQSAWGENITLANVSRPGETFHICCLITIYYKVAVTTTKQLVRLSCFTTRTHQQGQNEDAMLCEHHPIWNSRESTITISRDTEHLHIKEEKLVTSDNPVLNNWIVLAVNYKKTTALQLAQGHTLQVTADAIPFQSLETSEHEHWFEDINQNETFYLIWQVELYALFEIYTCILWSNGAADWHFMYHGIVL